ncbi:DNA mismatch endonuclease Vsr [Serratia rubidaea]|uniref:very short patch repair endonuclease n=1 Tax=Serratia rubidaea TaxID=61652 RepID=UPI001F411657|nr:very short patch repair endonuclease [Serratia rubidaea]UJD78606.1 DNA mismatch endonuclease Vsr [Serratia rubidaea]UJD83157.1 DNA mismatch endonuclease Vsr [Serratia rubidaea]
MTDIFNKEKRSDIMSKVRSKNTKPEIMVRKGLYSKGFRYRLYLDQLPGKPDLCLKKYNAVIFVHGCLWHWHGCSRSRMPSSNMDYWVKKINNNRVRDQKNIVKLLNSGWRVLIIWECSVKKTLLDKTLLLTHKWLIGGEENFVAIEPKNKKEISLVNMAVFMGK